MDPEEKQTNNVSIVDGDLLEAKETFLLHQCNCVTVKSAHLAASVFKRFPYADIYRRRRLTAADVHLGPDGKTTFARPREDTPGTIVVCGGSSSVINVHGVPRTERKIINLLAQKYPGKSKRVDDTYAMRAEWFAKCLAEVGKLPELKTQEAEVSLAFPYKIGCGAAGGQWTRYYDMICKFAKTVPRVKIVIYKLLNFKE